MNGYQRSRRSLVTLVAVLIIGLPTAPAVSAQVISGRVSDAQSGIPVGSGFVVLLDRMENEVARSLWSQDGAFRLDYE